MQINSREFFYGLTLGIFSTQCAWADDDVFHLNASVNEVWDSNFSRSPENDEEKYTLANAGVRFDKTFGRQRFFANWQATRFDFSEHPDFNATAQAGEVAWQGLVGSQVNTEVDWKRNDYLVDRLEFFGRDVVSREDLTGRIGYGNDGLLSFHAGAVSSKQTHSNDLRSGLDFDENQAFADAGYLTRNKSSLYIRFISGKREYTQAVDDSLDFDFRQLELDGVWNISPKTKLSGKVAGFNRDGIVNEASGSLANLNLSWQATEKILLDIGYTLTHPAIGETSDAPSKVQQGAASLKWELTSKISLASSLRYSTLNYDAIDVTPARQEHLYDASLLTLNYQPYESWMLRANFGWRKNESPLYYRNYTSRVVMLGVVFNY